MLSQKRHGLLVGALIAVVCSSCCQAFAGSHNRWGPTMPNNLSKLKSSATDADTKDTANTVNGDDENKVTTADILSLDSIRSTLIRQEETIIFAIIERSQYRRNSIVYKSGGFGDMGTPFGSDPCPEGSDKNLSFLEYMLIGTEVLHCGVRRYTSPEEHAFFPERLSGANKALPTLDFPSDLLSNAGGASSINFNPILLKKYIENIVPMISNDGDDEQHGSTVLADITVLQALSRRVHYGKFVAESKYLSDPEGYQKLVDAGDAEGVMALLTNAVVEAKVLRRARMKAATYGREPLILPEIEGVDQSEDTGLVAAAAASAVVATIEAMKAHTEGKVDPAVIEALYKDFIIPLTKDIEVAYLFRRCGRDPPPEYAPDRMSIEFL
mmetsp:Transcript_28064/g.39446  ORF Transcript_28064/g.39446 Transcript_28064/m.39446 type:complete len:383 (-) Transcript_28064:1623-2771(-)